MNKFILIIILLFIGCAPNNFQESTCLNNGSIDFMYINIPCDECINLIENILKNNPHIFNYDITQNKKNHIIINYCYDYKKISPQNIEKIFTDNSFPINKSMTDAQNKNLQDLCCKIP